MQIFIIFITLTNTVVYIYIYFRLSWFCSSHSGAGRRSSNVRTDGCSNLSRGTGSADWVSEWCLAVYSEEFRDRTSVRPRPLHSQIFPAALHSSYLPPMLYTLVYWQIREINHRTLILPVYRNVTLLSMYRLQALILTLNKAHCFTQDDLKALKKIVVLTWIAYFNTVKISLDFIGVMITFVEVTELRWTWQIFLRNSLTKKIHYIICNFFYLPLFLGEG